MPAQPNSPEPNSPGPGGLDSDSPELNGAESNGPELYGPEASRPEADDLEAQPRPPSAEREDRRASTHEVRPASGVRPIVVGAVLGVNAVAAGFSAAGVRSQPVPALALLFLLAGPGAALGWALPGQTLRLRLLVGIFGGLVVDTLIAQTMLSLRLWSPRGGALGALAVTAALLCCGAFAVRRRRSAPRAVPDPRPTES
ncbi:hypothetical protein [Streptacidiphilus anmyonensis]|uniref:hypothetical protein n=1 Tax=Streptacidiphilus anmyonensis TaxID=405782 RepID=UPI00128E944E|nr:hypothetical protein [Streptacidiphilus anmyonensis]